MSLAVRRLAAMFCVIGFSSVAQARISDEDKWAAGEFLAVMNGEREFGDDFMVEVPTGDELIYLMNLKSCKPGGMREGLPNTVAIRWSCKVEGERFKKTTLFWMEEGRIQKVGVFDDGGTVVGSRRK